MNARARPAPSGNYRAGRAIGTAALIIMLGNLTTSTLGFVRQAVITAVFGRSPATDAFFAASIVPQMFYDLTIGAAVSAALIPTLTEVFEARGREDAWRLFGSVLGLAWVVLAVVVIALELAAQPLMSLILWGYHTQLHGGAVPIAVEVVRVLIPTLFFLGTSAVILSMLYSMRRFTAPAFATALYHTGVIGGALALSARAGILALPIGALVGSAAQVVVQVPALLRNGLRVPPSLRMSAEVRRILRLYAPVAAGLLMSIAGQIIDITFKSELRGNAITVMQLATTLTQFPIGIAVAALSFAVLPAISADAAFDRMEEFKAALALGMRFVLFITIPAAAGLISLSTPIVSLLFQHGHFHHGAAVLTATALEGYAIQIPFVGVDQLLIFSFYARKNTVTPMLVGVVGVCIYVVSAVLLMPRLQIFGLALANTLQNSLHAFILFGLLLSAIGSMSGRGIALSAAKSAIAGITMGASAWLLAHLLARILDTQRFAGQAVDALLPIIAGTILYVAAARLLRNEELAFAVTAVRSRFSSRHGVITTEAGEPG